MKYMKKNSKITLTELRAIVRETLKEEKSGLWANIRAKRERGEKSAHPNSKEFKDAVKAGKKINQESTDVNIDEQPLPVEVKKKTEYGELESIIEVSIKGEMYCIKMDDMSKYLLYKVVNDRERLLLKNGDLSVIKRMFKKIVDDLLTRVD